MISLTIPIKLISEANSHTHWRLRQKRAKAQRATVAFHMMSFCRGDQRLVQEAIAAGLVVTLTRIGPRSLDSDNNVGAAKHVRDQIAEWLGVNDNDPRVEWRYAQERGKPKEYAVRIEIDRARSERRTA